MANLTVSADIDAFMAAANDAAARTELGLGTIATQAAAAVALTGGTIENTTIGAVTETTGRFTTATLTGLTTSHVPYSVSGLLTGTADFRFTSGATSSLVVGSSAIAPGNFVVDGAAATSRSMLFKTAGVDRWLMRADNATESGSDSGTQFKLSAFTDAGVLIDSPLEIVRSANGAFTIRRPITMVNAIRYAIIAQSSLSATINMGLSDIARFAHGSAQTVTTISIAGTGQRVTFIFTNGNTTIQNNATIKLAGGADFVGSADDVLSLVYESTSAVWREVSRSLN
ncbi:MAG: hypothetical protein V4636_13125 [Pseudomonadota bacterium]